MFIVLFSAPSAGKGTQAIKLKEYYGLPHISAGELLRERRKIDDQIGNIIALKQDSGELVDQEIINGILIDRLSQNDCKKGLILDGYPRTISQAESLSKLLGELNKEINYVFYLNVTKEEMIKRSLGRLICDKCGATYNKFNQDYGPIKEDYCDKCNSKLVNRIDDKEEVINKRYEEFLKESIPLIDYYMDQKILFEVNANINAETTFETINQIIGKNRK